ncbi:NADPH-dependent F420 reductase [Streptomyces sp. NPDC127098]|uniref:NADPH-dependent F420 reductase n=1 Tax=Streptomyces sp. NPDC127098 TaxID=3347137 RepID=UPI00365FB7D3
MGGPDTVTKTIGLIGAGMIGGTVARLAVAAGLDVVLSNSRDPETLTDLVADLGARARAATPAEAALAGDLVVVAVPLHAHEQLPTTELVGKVVIDTMNYYPERDGRIGELDAQAVTSSELVRGHLVGSRLVKAFNNISFQSLLTLARPAGAPDRSALPIAGDDPEAKDEVAELLDALGYDAVDIGALADSWRSEPGTPVYGRPYFPAERPPGLNRDEAFRWFLETPSVPVSADQVRELTADVVRGTPGGVLPDDA